MMCKKCGKTIKGKHVIGDRAGVHALSRDSREPFHFCGDECAAKWYNVERAACARCKRLVDFNAYTVDGGVFCSLTCALAQFGVKDSEDE